MPSRYSSLTHDQLATLVPELLLCGQLIDRAGMPYCIQHFGQDGMTQIAIEEWMGASPVYTRRMQVALDYASGDLLAIFKGMQLDIGAPPQFMDFRYVVHDRWSGGFSLAHCGALMDVEPMGDDYVTKMCHDIEDPTFDATAVATNPKARMRPVHRPPRRPAGRNPACEWIVDIDPTREDLQPAPEFALTKDTHVATLVLDPIDPADEGLSDYSGPVVDDLDFTAYSHSALVRIVDEVVIQMHLLNLSFRAAVEKRARDTAELERVLGNQAVGVAGITGERIARALGLDATPEDAARLLELHPLLNPHAYVDVERDGATLRVGAGPAHDDGTWISLVNPDRVEQLQAAVRGLDPHLDVEVTGTASAWSATVVRRSTPAKEAEAVVMTKFSTGATFAFEPRRSLPLTVL